MKQPPISLRTFLGAQNYELSRQFYLDWGFEEFKTSDKMSYFHWKGVGFYLQDYYVTDWVNNSMMFLEVEQLEPYLEQLRTLASDPQYGNVKVTDIQVRDWGREFFVHDPSGILWHIGTFQSPA